MMIRLSALLWHKQTHQTNTGGRIAREQAERELVRVRAQTPYYEGLGNDLRRLRERNHFAENIRATMQT